MSLQEKVEAPVLTYTRHHTGVIELNRPRALNSLNPEMVSIIATALDAWRGDDDITQIIILSNSPKAFCAGGDVRHARDAVLGGHVDGVDDFFAHEYDTNADIGEYPKPIAALIDGVVMGGGLGISAHGSHRIVTERAFASMPETAIGYFTDVGVAHMSQRMVGSRGVASPEIAKFWALTGYRMYAADMLWSGLATSVISDPEGFVADAIEQGIEAAVDKHATEPAEPAPLATLAPAIEEAFAHETWPEIRAAAQAHPDLAELLTKLTASGCVTSIVASLELFHAESGEVSLREGLELEKALGKLMYRRDDFAEGIRAVLVDKSFDAKFSPVRGEDVDVDSIRAALNPRS